MTEQSFVPQESEVNEVSRIQFVTAKEEMENRTLKEETSTGQHYTPVYHEADYPELMRDDRWTRVDWNETSEVHATVPYAGESKPAITDAACSAYSN
ncbi:hypothetical protein EGR_11109 [Echinococcus granulosus]|uniref:Uncharacterized protein n=1 Tax=Echinococcus granulosus TaxID=6210 RepID=W6UKL7_ECHGR|nr:hypothetical protein EGR_11109 [Echinococcus granulosus]EUB54034.1 hypothetical protein EGR_11109 [Echinococcus granulosus]